MALDSKILNGTKKNTSNSPLNTKYSDAVSILNGTGTAGYGTTPAPATGGTKTGANSPLMDQFYENYGFNSSNGATVDKNLSPALNIINSNSSEAQRQNAAAGISGTEQPTTTSYIDNSGNKRTGTISYSDALSGNYTAPAATTPSVDTSYLTNAVSDAGTSTSIDYLTQLKDQMESDLQTALANADAESSAALQRALSKINQQIDVLNTQYRDTNKQLYTDYMLSKKNLPQQLAALGYSGGLTESSLLGLDTNYGSSLAANERNRLTDVSNLQSGLTDEEFQAAQDLAARRQSLNEDYQTRYATVMQALQAQKNYEAEQSDEAANTAKSDAIYRAQYGDFSGISAIYGDAVASAMKAQYDAANAPYTPAPEEDVPPAVSGYDDVSADINDYVANGNASMMQISAIITQALNAGTINTTEYTQLRQKYLGR